MVKQLTKKNNIFILLFFLVYALYLLILIYQSSFVIGNTRYFSLFDDMMVSMRYGKNLAHGFGLVWNPGGERVEGFTNPLWTLIMAGVHFLPFPPEKLSLCIQLLGVVFMLLTVYVIKQILSFLTKKPTIILFGMFLTAFYYPLNKWSVILGTEVSILSFLISLLVFFTLKGMKDAKYQLFAFVVLAIGTLVRMDMIVPTVLYTIYFFFIYPKAKKKIGLLGVAVVGFFVLLQTIFRYWYYGDFLPNTYYLKLTGYPLFWRVLRGVYYLQPIMNWTFLFISLVYAFIIRHTVYFLILLLFLGQLLYSAYIGGDAWEFFGGTNRYTTIVMPIFFVLIALTAEKLQSLFMASFSRYFGRYAFLVSLAFVLFTFLSFNTRGDTMLPNLLLISPSHTTVENRLQVEFAQTLTKVTKKDARIGIVWAGTVPYFTDRYYYDLLGKNDRYIGHKIGETLIKSPSFFEHVRAFYPGHMKWDYAYMAKKKIDIFAQVFPDDQKALLRSYGYKPYIYQNKNELYVLPSSKNINWSEIKAE